jgi:mannose/cellobiose epimerase-like protein (N-acyl-D-glucosamine 2-epimerase family)
MSRFIELFTAAALADISNSIMKVIKIERDFMKPEFEAALETVGANGKFCDNFEGRMICPGHAIEAAWFILHEAKQRNNDTHWRKLGAQLLDWSWQKGWDDEYGGILYYRDVKGLPCTEYWHDIKFWWPHNEACQAIGEQQRAFWAMKLRHEFAQQRRLAAIAHHQTAGNAILKTKRRAEIIHHAGGLMIVRAHRKNALRISAGEETQQVGAVNAL